MIKAFKKVRPAPRYLIIQMLNLPHEPLIKEIRISNEISSGNDIG